MKKPDEILSMLQELSQSNLTANQARFIKGLKKYYKHFGKLSEKQYGCLKSIYEQQFRQVEMNHLINNE